MRPERTLPLRVGQVWKEKDGRFDRAVKIVEVFSDGFERWVKATVHRHAGRPHLIGRNTQIRERVLRARWDCEWEA